MNSPLEVDGITAQYFPETKTLIVNGYPVLPPRVVTVCAWTDCEKVLTKELTQAGFEVSHSITHIQRTKFFQKV